MLEPIILSSLEIASARPSSRLGLASAAVSVGGRWKEPTLLLSSTRLVEILGGAHQVEVEAADLCNWS
jgi:hypothetical protein